MRGSPDSIRSVIEEAGLETAQIVAVNARRRAPVRTGLLRSIIQSVGNTVESSAPYSVFVERGTQLTRAQPFLEPSVAEAEPILRRVIVEKLRERYQP